MKKKTSLKIAVLVFALTFAVGVAFAATNGMLVFGGTVRINSAAVSSDDVRLEFIAVNISLSQYSFPLVEGSSRIVEGSNRQKIEFDINFLDLETLMRTGSVGRYSLLGHDIQVNFVFQNTGTVPVRIIGFDHDIDAPPVSLVVRTGLFDVAGNALGQSVIHLPERHELVPPSSLPTPIGGIVLPGQSVHGHLTYWTTLFRDYAGLEDDSTFTYWLALNYEQAE